MLDIGLVQMTSGVAPEHNIAHTRSAIQTAADQGAKLVLTPEMTGVLDGNRARLLAHVQEQDADPVLAAVRDAAARAGAWVLLGSLALRAAGEERLVNRSFLIDDAGEIRASYDKIHLFDVDLPSGERYRESANYRPGDQAVLAATPWGGLGMTICYDVRFPQLYRALAQAGAAMIAVPAAFTAITGRAHWHTLLRARAIETGCFILAPAQTGVHEDGRSTFGHSLVVAPWGEIVADGGEAPGVVMARLDLTAIEEARRRIPQLTHDRPIRLREDAAS